MSTATIEKKTATQIPAKAKTTRKKAVAAPMNPPTAPAVEDTNKTEVEAKKAQESARALFTGGNAAEMPTSELTEADFVDGKIDILGVLVKSGLSASRSEARRAVEQGGVVVADEKVTDVKTTYAPEQFDGEGLIVRRGKKNFKRVVMSK